jgi:hypothetical protein
VILFFLWLIIDIIAITAIGTNSSGTFSRIGSTSQTTPSSVRE